MVGRKRSEVFVKKWLKIFCLDAFEEDKIAKELLNMPFSEERDLPLLKFLFLNLPKILDKRRSEYVWNLANAYAFSA